MAEKKMPIGLFVNELRAAVDRKDGYIMGAKGQEPKNWSPDSWWFAQYSGKQKEKALYWRGHAQFVWDCNGLAEGIYEKWSGVNINTKARYAYADWCGAKGSGTIPVDKRVEGAAVYWGEKASNIHHVAYLDRPVVDGKPEGDWYIIEARGVLYGVVRTRMSERKPNFWGWMDKYFDYDGADYAPAEPELGEITLKRGMKDREDVRVMQESLIALGYDLGQYGADGDFGGDTEDAVRAFQTDNGLTIDGEYGSETHAALTAALGAQVVIAGGDCWIRDQPSAEGRKLGVAKEGSRLPYAGETADNGWLKTDRGWVSGKYGSVREVSGRVG